MESKAPLVGDVKPHWEAMTAKSLEEIDKWKRKLFFAQPIAISKNTT